MVQQEIKIQKNLIAQYEVAGNSIGVAFHKAKLNNLINKIIVKGSILVK